MARRNWKVPQPTSLPDAMEACIDFARERHNLSIDRIADRMGLPSKWALYKWVESGGLPIRLVASFEHACGAHFVTAYLAGAAHKLLIEIPRGRVPSPGDIALVQSACTDAVRALIGFADGHSSAADTQAALTTAMERLAYERGQVAKAEQPELDLS